MRYVHDIKENIKYKTLIRIKYDKEENTYYSGFITDNDDVKRPGKYVLNRTGGFIENIGKINGHLLKRQLAVENCWYFNEEVASPVVDYKYMCNDTSNSKSWQQDNSIVIQIGGNIAGDVKTFSYHLENTNTRPVLPNIIDDE